MWRACAPEFASVRTLTRGRKGKGHVLKELLHGEHQLYVGKLALTQSEC